MIRRHLFILVCLAMVGCAEDGIPLVGMDHDKSPVTVFVSQEGYEQRLTQLINDIEDSTLETLHSQPKDRVWKLSTVIVGFGFNFDVGLGPILRQGISAKARVAFSKDPHPELP